jgi:two-component system sensor histidine kinase QseC
MSTQTSAPTTTRWFSLQRRLLGLLLGGVTVGWLVTMSFSYVDAHHEIDELFDAQLAQAAQTLLALASEYDDDDDIAELSGDGHKYQKKIVFQLWDDQAHLLLRSREAPTTPLTAIDGFSEQVNAQGERWRYYRQWDRQRQLHVQVGENHHVREEISGNIVLRMLAPAVFGLPLIGLWVWFAIRRGIAPIATVTEQVAGRAPEHLEALAPVTAPQEIRPLIDALNDLFGRVDRALDNERRFTADAAHELRTPLAAIVTQAQVASRARDAAERDQALVQIATSGRRASRLVEQLLLLARLDPAANLHKEKLRLDQLAAAVCADHGSMALDKNITLELDTSGEIAIHGHADLLRVLLRNLLDNALRYTPAGEKVGVGVTVHGSSVRLTVSDSGPGIPPAERANVMRRFHRLAGQETEGSGLGLSIVARIAELHHASVVLADGMGASGLSVQVSFPLLSD